LERFWHRKKILKAKPVVCPPDSELEVHVQVCKRDWINGIWTIMSFAHYGKKQFRLVMVHDETVPEFAWDHFKRLFPGVIISDREKLRPEVEEKLKPLSPTIAKMWESGYYVTLPKVVDSWLLAKNQTVVTLDADVLFFDYPNELLDDSIVTGQLAILNHVDTAGPWRAAYYCIDANALEEDMGIALPGDFGLGLGRVNLACYDWAMCERVLSSHPLTGHVKHFMIDQTIMGMWAAQSGFETLESHRYAVRPVESLTGVVARHYFAKTRDLMYVEGIRTLRKRWGL
jgi:hypothetical protein